MLSTQGAFEEQGSEILTKIDLSRDIYLKEERYYQDLIFITSHKLGSMFRMQTATSNILKADLYIKQPGIIHNFGIPNTEL